MRIAHIINPVLVGQKSDLYVAQPVTFRAMFAAKRYAIDEVDVELMAISYQEDDEILPSRFHKLPFLTRSVLDVGQFEQPRKLPLIKDILDAAMANSDADYFIYSNVDISPMPYFYSAIGESLTVNDALVINRRTIGKADSSDVPLSQFYCQVGESHPGFDCFVFSRSQLERFKLYQACIGANWIGRVLICNLLAHADNPRIMTDEHLTFHLGDDRSWKTAANIPFDTHNEIQVGKLMHQLHRENLTGKHDLLERSYKEFHLKTIDPDPTRPKDDSVRSVSAVPQKAAPALTVAETKPMESAHSATVTPKPNRLAALPTKYMPTGPWDRNDALVLRQDPVFLVGHPRSGTTLLHSLIGTQVVPAIFPETHFFSIVRKRFNLVEDRIQPGSLEKVLAFLNEKLELSPEFENHVRSVANHNELSPKMLFEALVYDQLSRHLPSNQISDSKWMEKTPDHAEHLEAMAWYYPQAKFIFIVREPEKAILSRRRHFTWNNESSWPISQHADRWLKTITSVDAFRENNSGKIHYVRFEDLVADNANELKQICDFLGVNFDPGLLSNQEKFSQQQCLNWESWKADAAAPVSRQVATGVNEKMSSADKAELKARLHDYLVRFDYTTKLKHAM